MKLWRRFVGWLRDPCERISAGGVRQQFPAGPVLSAGNLAVTTVDGHTTTLRQVRSVTVADVEVQAHSCHIKALSSRVQASGCAVEPLPDFAEPNFYVLRPGDRTVQ